MNDRRKPEDRRRRDLIPEALERSRGERRQAERRDSPRLPARFLVSDGRGGGVEVEGDLGLGGASWESAAPPRSDTLELACTLPEDGVVVARMHIVRREARGQRTRLHANFAGMNVETELRLARWLDRGTNG